MKSKKKVSSSDMRNSVILLERLPIWISEQKSVKVFIKSKKFLIISLPSSQTRKRRCFFSKGSPGQVALQGKGGVQGTIKGLLHGKTDKCGKDFCRLGCVCESLNWKRKRTHCGHANCMFSKKCIGPKSTHDDSNRLTLLSLAANSPENEGISAKRPRRPPKRWHEEEEELELIAEAKKRSKYFVHASPPYDKGSCRLNGCARIVNLPVANEKCLAHDSMHSPCSHNGSISQPNQTLSMTIKSSYWKLMPKVSLLKKSMIGESSMTNDSGISNLYDGYTSSYSCPSLGNTLSNDANKPDASCDCSIQSIVARKYFGNYKEYRKVLTSSKISEKHLISMCTQFLSPWHVNSIILMKWDILEEKVRKNTAYLWLSHVPKCAAKMYVSESGIQPDDISINLQYVENVFGIPSSIDYLFQLYKKQPEQFGCCILACEGLHWEIKGNLNMRAKVSDKIHFKVMRSCPKGMKELTVANSGKKILINVTSYAKFNEDPLSDNFLQDEAVESEITEIPVTDIQLFDSTTDHYVGNSIKTWPGKNCSVAHAWGNADIAHSANSSLDNPVDDSALVHPSEDSTPFNLAFANHDHYSPGTAMSDVSFQEEVFTRGTKSTSLIMPGSTSRSLMEYSRHSLNLNKSCDKKVQVNLLNPSPDNLIGTSDCQIVAAMKSDTSTIAQGCHVKSGFLIPDNPTLLTVAATKGSKCPTNSRSITMVDPSWNVKGKPLNFKSEEAACKYLNAITKRKMYPDVYKVKWTFVEDKIYFKINADKGRYDIRKLTEDQFITPKGVFSYGDICTDYLTHYGFDIMDDRWLLECRRRRDIRNAENELIS